MADNFGLKLGIDGEKEFKNALKDINSQFKVLGSEMNLVTSEFSKNDKSQEAVTARSRVLRKEIDSQQEKIKTLESALQNASTSFGENDKRTQSWATQLNNAKADLNKLNNELDDTEKEANNFGDEIKEAGNKSDDASNKFSKLGSVCKVAGAALGAAFAAVGAAAVSAGKALVEMSIEGSNYADDILTTASQTGIATDKLQEYSYAAELVDVSVETLTKSMAKNIKSMKSAQDGSATYVDAYSKLGVSVTDANGNLRDSDTVYWEIIDSLGNMKNETERDALAMTLLGKSAQDLNPLIEQGSQRMNELGQEAQKAGYVMSEDTLKAYGEFNDKIQYLKVGATGAKNALGTILMPVLNDLAGEGVDLLGEFTNGILDANGDIGKMSDVIGEILPKALDSIMPYIPEIIEIAATIVTSVAGAIVDNLPAIVDSATLIVMSLIEGIVAALPQITQGALQLVLALVSGILENLPAIIEAALTMVVTLATGIADALPELIPTIVETVLLIVSTLIDNLDLLLDAGFQLLSGLAEGLLNALPTLIAGLPQVIDSIVNFITNNIPQIINMGIQLTLQLAVGIIRAIPSLVAHLPQIIYSIINGLAQGLGSMSNMGYNLLAGLWNGIANAKNWLVQKIRNLGSVITDALKTVLGIHSPSTVFKEEIGTNLALGLGEGFEDTMKSVTKQMQKDVPTSFDIDTNLNATGITTGKTPSQATQSGVNLILKIENFNNNRSQDIEQLAEEISVALATSIRRKGAAF